VLKIYTFCWTVLFWLISVTIFLSSISYPSKKLDYYEIEYKIIMLLFPVTDYGITRKFASNRLNYYKRPNNASKTPVFQKKKNRTYFCRVPVITKQFRRLIRNFQHIIFYCTYGSFLWKRQWIGETASDTVSVIPNIKTSLQLAKIVKNLGQDKYREWKSKSTRLFPPRASLLAYFTQVWNF